VALSGMDSEGDGYSRMEVPDVMVYFSISFSVYLNRHSIGLHAMCGLFVGTVFNRAVA
jgi:hypothetical protein